MNGIEAPEVDKNHNVAPEIPKHLCDNPEKKNVRIKNRANNKNWRKTQNDLLHFFEHCTNFCLTTPKKIFWTISVFSLSDFDTLDIGILYSHQRIIILF